jgi:hypothetical protein
VVAAETKAQQLELAVLAVVEMVGEMVEALLEPTTLEAEQAVVEVLAVELVVRVVLEL